MMDTKRTRYEKSKGSQVKVIKDSGDALRKKVASKESGYKSTSIVFGKTLRDRGDTDKPIKVDLEKPEDLKSKPLIEPLSKIGVALDSGVKKSKNKPIDNNLNINLYYEGSSVIKSNESTKDLSKDNEDVAHSNVTNLSEIATSSAKAKVCNRSSNIIKKEGSPVKIFKDVKVSGVVAAQKKDDTFIGKTSNIKDTRLSSKIGRLTNKVTNESDQKNRSDEKSDSLQTDRESSSIENTAQRKSIIKTVQASDSSKIPKGVTFTDQRRSPTTIQIKIPTQQATVRRTRIPKLINALQTKVKPTKSATSVKDKPVLNRKNRTERRNKRLQNRSPDSPQSVTKHGGSPQTEVAKWAPNSINKHTKPYYEAWVNTTLAAISKRSKFDKLCVQKQNIIHNFEMALEQRSDSPELVYENYADERYTGKIKVNQKSNKKVRH